MQLMLFSWFTWLSIGFIFLIVTLIKTFQDGEINKFFNDTWITMSLVLICMGLFGPIIVFIGYIKSKREERKLRRQTCGWWELKEFGGKY